MRSAAIVLAAGAVLGAAGSPSAPLLPESPVPRLSWDDREISSRITVASAKIIRNAVLNDAIGDCNADLARDRADRLSRGAPRFLNCRHRMRPGSGAVVRFQSSSDIPGWYDAAHSSMLSLHLDALPPNQRIDLPSPAVRAFYSDCTVWGCLSGTVPIGTIEIREVSGKASALVLKLRIGAGWWQDVRQGDSIDLNREVVISDIHECQRVEDQSGECA